MVGQNSQSQESDSVGGWRNFPLLCDDRRVFVRLEGRRVVEVALEEPQEGRLVAVPARQEPWVWLAAQVFALT